MCYVCVSLLFNKDKSDYKIGLNVILPKAFTDDNIEGIVKPSHYTLVTSCFLLIRVICIVKKLYMTYPLLRTISSDTLSFSLLLY